MIDLNQLEFVKLDRKGLDILIEWAKAEGWNPGPHDADVFWKTDPEGYYGFYHQSKLIAGGSVVSYNGDFGFMGFFIVEPGLRSKGIGRKLWILRRDILLSRLKQGASIGMDGVVVMQPFYNKGGFKIAYRDERYEHLGEKMNISSDIFHVNDMDFPDINKYDTTCLGYARSNFLKLWLHMPQSNAFGYSDDGTLKGFAVLRKAAIGYKIGPLFADDAGIAEELYKACLNAVPNEATFLDIPVENKAAVHLVQKYQAAYVFECARMYYGSPPDQAISKIFGITTFELG